MKHAEYVCTYNDQDSIGVSFKEVTDELKINMFMDSDHVGFVLLNVAQARQLRKQLKKYIDKVHPYG